LTFLVLMERFSNNAVRGYLYVLVKKETSFVGEINATTQRTTDVVEGIRLTARPGKDAVRGKPIF